MIEITIQREEAGRRLVRFLEKIFPQAPRSLFFKALRQQKIKVNGKKPADLSLVLAEGDQVRLFFTDQQLESFGYAKQSVVTGRSAKQDPWSDLPAVPVLYEDDNLLILDKPVGLLSQKSRPEDISLTEIGRRMLQERGFEPRGYRPGVCNRLDRNTAGAVIMAKTLEAGQAVAEMLRQHTLGKFYWALVEGRPEKWQQQTTLVHDWQKDGESNKVRLTSVDQSRPTEPGIRVESRVRLLESFDRFSLVEIQLLTGKSHQIRSQLAQEGHPIVGDGKYNPKARGFRPMLAARRLEFDHCPRVLSYMDGKKVEASLPEPMKRQLAVAGSSYAK